MIENLWNKFGGNIIQYGVKLLVAVLILMIGLWLAGKLTRGAKKLMQFRDLEPSLVSFFTSFISIALKILVVVIVLTTVGVEMTSIVAILGAMSLAVGMALSGTLQNLAGGIVILLFKPFMVGDTIMTVSGKTGVVTKIMIFTTELQTGDKQTVYLPNGPLSNGELVNLSRHPRRRVDLVVGIGYGDDVAIARAAILDILNSDARVLQDDIAPTVFVSALAGSSVNITIRYWTEFEDYASTQPDVLEKIYNDLPARGIHFPFPQMDVHMDK